MLDSAQQAELWEECIWYMVDTDKCTYDGKRVVTVISILQPLKYRLLSSNTVLGESGVLNSVFI